MVKQRMTALDVRATVEEMRAQLTGLRLLNIYNISNKMFLFKFGQGENKRSVLLENGIRFHLTELAREKPKVPSQFTLKLRKHIRAWRLDTITQLQHDRTIDLCFGVASTEGCFHIIVELFSKGNVILTDHNYKMMMLLRTHRDDEGLNLVVNEIYPVTAPFAGGGADGSVATTHRTGPTAATATGAASVSSVSASVSVSGAATAAAEEPHVMLYTPSVDAAGRLHVQRIPDAELTAAQRQLKASRVRGMKAEWEVGLSRSNDRTVLQSLVAGIQHFGPDLAQHVLTVCHVPNTPMRSWTETSDAVFNKIVEGLLEAYDLAKVDLTSAGGYLIKKSGKAGAKHGAAASASDVAPAAETISTAAITVAVAEQYESFTPILLAQYTLEGVESLYRPSFGRVCDDFFLITETERIDASNDKRSKAAKSKESKFAADHARRINGLESDIAKYQQKGEQLILNAEKVDEAIQLINGALATGISWDALRSLLKRRNAEGHPVAYMIHELFLERNAISVLLESTLEDEEDDCDVPPLVVEVNLSKTAHANAADYFARQKQNKSKLERTVASTDKAAAGAARKGARKAAEQKEKKVIVKERQRNWWEKFFWFRTTAGDLVLRGKDVQSTELLLRRVKKLGDFFVQCEVDGSLPCLVRPMSHLWHQEEEGEEALNTRAGVAGSGEVARPIASASLCEAGAWCVAFSGAWESKQTTGAWWIYASQVTGGSAAGMYIFSGERHYLPPQPMSLGCALLFYVTRTVHEAAPPLAALTDKEAPQHEAEGEEEEEVEEVAHVLDNTPSVEEMVRQELPRLPTKAQLRAAATDVTDVDTASTDVIPADTATALADMPTIEALRADQRRQQQTYGGARSGNAGGAASVKGKKGGYARNARVDRAALQSHAAGSCGASVVGVSVVSSAAPEGRAALAAAATNANNNNNSGSAPPPQPQQQQGGKALSKHQKKKLKKIQDKYGDQDEEDRVLGAQVNGNQLSRVQLLELERLAAARQAEEAERKRQAKAARQAARDAGTLRYRAVNGSGGSGSEDDDDDDSRHGEEEVEEVSDFTDDEGMGRADTEQEEANSRGGLLDRHHGGRGDRHDAAGASGPVESPPPPPPPATDDLAEDSEKEEPATATASPTVPQPAEDPNDGEEAEEEEEGDGSASQAGAATSASRSVGGAAAAAAHRSDRDAAVAQQTIELNRAFVHYTMRPAPTDVVQHVVAVCAPMMVVNEYAYHVTLAMGNAKKGVLAGKVLQVFGERAQRGVGAGGGGGTAFAAGGAGAGSGVSASRKEQKRAAKAHADPSKPITAKAAGGGGAAAAAEAAVVNPTVVKALQMTSPNDIVEQLRANVKPVDFKI